MHSAPAAASSLSLRARPPRVTPPPAPQHNTNSSSTTKYIGLIDNNPSSEITISWSTPNGACIGQWTVETYRKSDNKQIGSAVIKPPQPYQSSSSYTQKTANAGASYYYKITATAATARVAPVTTTSPVITAAPKPSCSNVQPVAGSFAMKTAYIGLVDGNPSSNMELTWSVNGACVSSYTVETYRNKDKAKIGSASVTSPSFQVKTLSAGAEYYYKARTAVVVWLCCRVCIRTHAPRDSHSQKKHKNTKYTHKKH